ncbi:hypothetical protein FRB90_008488 [Tulasnella sp. 427]|nr:hypothetical protein FRB90_008488 [Tulasnella sp. 427]
MNVHDTALTIHEVLEGRDLASPIVFEPLSNAFMLVAKQLAESVDFRKALGQEPTIWEDLETVWKHLPQRICVQEPTDALRNLCICTSRFTRNLVAGVPENQIDALQNEPQLRAIIQHFSSFFLMEDSANTLLLRTVVQALSNILTANNEAQDAVWPVYMSLPDERNILLRLLASPDLSTATSTMILVLNCINGSRERSQLLVSSRPAGVRLSKALLDKVDLLLEASETTEQGKTFEICYSIFRNVFDMGLFATAWESLWSPDDGAMTITPHQTILLKLLDAHLQLPTTRSEGDSLALLKFLAELHLQLADVANKALHAYLTAAAEDEEHASLDERLPKVVEAIVLVTQALCALLLASASQSGGDVMLNTAKAVRLQEDDGSEVLLSDLSVDLLKELDSFLPRIILGKAAQDSSRPNIISHEAQSDPTGFAYIKRDLVRLLGILCHNDKDIQDSIRAREGIQLIMNLCVVDERNPYLREHALFTLKNLLQNNPENQAVVDEFKPLVQWDQEGNLIV